MADKKFEVVVWGSTGFTGKLVAEYLLKQYDIGKTLSWAIAGRNQEKLEKIRAELGNENIPILVADSQDKNSLENLAKQTKVICTTVGPYAKYGDKLVDVCVEQGVHYCDLTGEVQWIRRMIDKHHDTAKKNKVKIVHCCGFDSIPSDMGVYFLQKEAKKQFEAYANTVNFRLKTMKGGFSGGTIASLENVNKEVSESDEVLKVLQNPYSLNPLGEQEGDDVLDMEGIAYDKEFDSWLAPFVMAPINTRVVRRSHALSGFPYGKDFRYDEAMLVGTGIFGRMTANVISTLFKTFNTPKSFFKSFLLNFMPKPGQGPSQSQRENGRYSILFVGKLNNGKSLKTKVKGDKDPGYGSTSKMFAESAVCLAKDKLPETFGVITPSTAMADALLERLQSNAGLEFLVIEKLV